MMEHLQKHKIILDLFTEETELELNHFFDFPSKVKKLKVVSDWTIEPAHLTGMLLVARFCFKS